MKNPKAPSLSADQVDELMLSAWNMRIATVGPGTRINLTPLWFGWAGGNIYFFCRGQKVVNLRRDSTATVIVDRNEHFPDLQGAMFQGRAVVLENAAAEASDPHLGEIRAQMASKYASGGSVAPRHTELTAVGTSFRWVRLQPSATITWDNFKLPRR
ncbi:MAG: pyridoxamine 5'-phosphate oxidase family protein [Anaerolineaceae bacterium]